MGDTDKVVDALERIATGIEAGDAIQRAMLDHWDVQEQRITQRGVISVNLDEVKVMLPEERGWLPSVGERPR